MENHERREKPKYHIDPHLRRGFYLNDMVVLPNDGMVICHGEQHHLPPKAMELLLFLAQNRNRLLSVEKLLVFGWGDVNAKRANLTHVISEIRQALDDQKACPEFIQTLQGKGYRLIAEVFPLDGNVHYHPTWPLKKPPQSSRLSEIKKDNHWHMSLALFKNSRLFSVSIAFVVSTWVLIQVFEVLFPIFGVPQWGLKLAVLILVVGFPLALLFTWLKEIKIKKILLAKAQEESKRQFFFKQLAVDFAFIGLMSIGVGYLAFHLIESIEIDQSAPPEIAEHYQLTVPLQNDLIAVLPFQYSTDAVIPDYYKKTLQSELILTLGNQNDFRLVSQRAVNDQPINTTLAEYAEKLGARYLLDGQVSGKDSNITVMLNLIDTQNTIQVWGTSIVGKSQELLELQKEIYRQVFNAFALLSEHSPSDDFKIISTNDFKAYDSYIQGKNELANATTEQQLKIAERFFLESLNSDPKFSLATAGLCQTYLDQYGLKENLSSFEAAKEQCSVLLSVGQLKADGNVALGNLNRISGKHEVAIDYYQKAVAINPENIDALSGMAKSYREIGSYQHAEELLRQVILIEPGYWKNYVNLGDFFFYVGNYKAAIEQYRRVTLMRPDEAVHYNSLGAAFYLDTQFEQASIAWGRSLALEPSAEMYSNLGTALFFSEQFEQAAINYENALKLNPNDAVIWANLGDAQKFANKKEIASQSYQKALQLTEESLLINPYDQTTLGMRAKMNSELGKCDEAMATVEAIVPQGLNDPYLYYDLSIAALRCQKNEQAKVLINQAITYGYSAEILRRDIQFAPIINQIELNQHESKNEKQALNN